MKKTIRLTESDLHKLIKRAIYEATKGERGMSNKQKQRRRNANYIKDVNGSGDKYFHPNTYSDYEPSNVDRHERNAPFHGNDWFDDKVHTDRMKKHRSSQNHKDPDDFMESVIRESVKRVLRETSDQTVFNAQKKIGQMYDDYREGDLSDFSDRKDRQYDFFNDEAERRINNGGDEIQSYMRRIGSDFDSGGELEDAANANYFEKRDLIDAIADDYGLSADVAERLLNRYLAQTYGRYKGGNTYGSTAKYRN